MKWEAKRFPCLASSHDLQQLTQGLVHLQKSLVGLELATKADLASSSGHNEQRVLLCQIMRDAFVYVTDWVCLALKYASTDIRRSSPASHAHRQVVIEEGKEVLLSFHEALFHARRQLGYTLPTVEELQLDNSTKNKIGRDTFQGNGGAGYEENHDDADHIYAYSPHQNDADHESDYSCSDSEMVETICNAAREQLEYRISTASDVGREDAVAVLGEVPTNQRLHLQHGCHVNTSVINHLRESSCKGLHLISCLPTAHAKGEPPTSFGDQATAFFFLFNVQRFVQETIHILESSKEKVLPECLEHTKVLQVKVIASPSDAQTSRFQPASQNKRLASDPNCLHYYPASNVNRPQPAPSDEIHPRQGHSVQKLCRMCSADSSFAMSKEKDQSRSNRLLTSLKALKPYPQQLRQRLKCL